MSETTKSLQKINRVGMSQYHNTVPFYKGDFQFMENSLQSLESLNDFYDQYDVDLDDKAEVENYQNNLKSRKENNHKISILKINDE